MKHNIHVEGYAFALRPVALQDAEFIVEVRTPERARFMHPITRTIEAQQEYLKGYFQRLDDYYFVVERRHDRMKEGLVSLYEFDHLRHSAQWGRLILRPESFAAPEMALLSFRLAFDIFSLSEVWCVALSDNFRMISFAEKCGFEREGVSKVILEDKVHDGIRYVLTKDRWGSLEKKVAEVALQTAKKIQPN
jgi:RimJ/RimL family protein N-acetyltransferase